MHALRSEVQSERPLLVSAVVRGSPRQAALATLFLLPSSRSARGIAARLVLGLVALACADSTEAARVVSASPAGVGGAPSRMPDGGAGSVGVARRPRDSVGGGASAVTAIDAGATDAGDGDAGSIAACVPLPNPGSPADGDVNIDVALEFQHISGFGGINVPGWIDDLTPEQVDTAFGNGPGQMGMSILRVRIPFDPDDFAAEVPAAVRAVSLGAKVMATPWTPPPSMKTNNDPVGGELAVASYGAYAEHLLSFRDFMESSGVPIYAISVQNEPDISVDYESCDWTPAQLVDWITEQGSRFGDTKLIAAESYRFDRGLTDPILQDPAAAAEVDIIGAHIYGSGIADYPLARSSGKEVWMTEHYTDSNNSANAWPLALNVGKEIHDCMAANFSAYVWWYIRRSYGPLTEDGLVSKRGYLMAQYAKFIRPGYVRIGATPAANPNVHATAYKGPADQVVLVAVNQSAQPQDIAIDVFNGCVETFSRFTTSATKSLGDDGPVALTDGRAALTLDGQSVTTFVSE